MEKGSPLTPEQVRELQRKAVESHQSLGTGTSSLADALALGAHAFDAARTVFSKDQKNNSA